MDYFDDTDLIECMQDVYAQKNNTYRELLKTMTVADVTDQVRNTLKKLHEAGFKLAIGSSSKNAKFIWKM